MPGRTVSIELTDDQAALLDDIATGQRTTTEKLLLEAVAHGLAMIVAGIDNDELHNATRDPPVEAFTALLPDPPRKRRRRSLRGEWEGKSPGPQTDDDIPF